MQDLLYSYRPSSMPCQKRGTRSESNPVQVERIPDFDETDRQIFSPINVIRTSKAVLS